MRRLLSWIHALPTTTFEGKIFVTATLLFGIFAIPGGGNLKLLVLAAMVAVAFVSVWASVRNLGGLSFERSLPERVRAGDDFDVRLTITNRRRWTPALAIVVRDAIQSPGSTGEPPCAIERVPPGSSVTVTYRARVWKRGAYDVSAALFITRFPFGLFEKRTILTSPSSILVTPREARIPKSALADARDEVKRGDQGNVRRARGGDEFRGLREYRPGDALRCVAWKASARHGGLLVRELDHRRAQRFLILLDTRPSSEGGRHSSLALEKSLRIVAGLALRARKLKQPTSVAAFAPGYTVVRHVEHPMGHEVLLEVLALLDPATGRSLDDLLTRLDPRSISGASVVVVTPARSAERELIEERIRGLGGEPRMLPVALRRRRRAGG